jgi:rhodanese-related sulfurtransferase
MEHTEGYLRLVTDAKLRVRLETADQALVRMRGIPGARLIDVREDHEWQAGHIRWALHLGKGIIERDIERIIPNMDTELHLYCDGGYRSALAADSLQKMGYNNVFSIEGGYAALRALDVEIQSEP